MGGQAKWRKENDPNYGVSKIVRVRSPNIDTIAEYAYSNEQMKEGMRIWNAATEATKEHFGSAFDKELAKAYQKAGDKAYIPFSLACGIGKAIREKSSSEKFDLITEKMCCGGAYYGLTFVDISVDGVEVHIVAEFDDGTKVHASYDFVKKIGDIDKIEITN